MILLLSLLLSVPSHACDLLSKIPRHQPAKSVRVDFHRPAGKPEEHYTCASGQLDVIGGPTFFRLQRFHADPCGDTQAPFSVNTYTADIEFEKGVAVYYDRQSVRHILDVSCTASDVVIDIPDRKRIDTMPPGHNRIQFHEDGSGLLLTWTHLTGGGGGAGAGPTSMETNALF